MEIKKIAWIGTGVMGKGMIHNLSQKYELIVTNRTLSKAYALEGEHVHAADTVEECIRSADVICTMLGFPKDVEEIYNKMFSCETTAKVMIDFTTSDAELAGKLYEKGKAKGISVMDAPVSGGDTGAVNGTLSIMAAGDKESYDVVYDMLCCMGKTITYCGEAGNGQHMKATNQIVVACNLAGCTEALVYALRNNIDIAVMFQCIENGAAASWQLTNNGKKAWHKDYAPGFFIKHFIKDLRIAKDIMNQKGINLEVTETVLHQLEFLAEHGYENEGTQALIEYYLRENI